jgi:RNA 3'-terminal phosphate cyclase
MEWGMPKEDETRIDFLGQCWGKPLPMFSSLFNLLSSLNFRSGKTSGLSPGFALLLTAETTAGATVGAECSADGAALPEDVANAATAALLEEVRVCSIVNMRVAIVHVCTYVFLCFDI